MNRMSKIWHLKTNVINSFTCGWPLAPENTGYKFIYLWLILSVWKQTLRIHLPVAEGLRSIYLFRLVLPFVVARVLRTVCIKHKIPYTPATSSRQVFPEELILVKVFIFSKFQFFWSLDFFLEWIFFWNRFFSLNIYFSRIFFFSRFFFLRKFFDCLDIIFTPIFFFLNFFFSQIFFFISKFFFCHSNFFFSKLYFFVKKLFIYCKFFIQIFIFFKKK